MLANSLTKIFRSTTYQSVHLPAKLLHFDIVPTLAKKIPLNEESKYYIE